MSPVLVKPDEREAVALTALFQLRARQTDVEQLVAYREEPTLYFQQKLGWSPWQGWPDHPGQRDVVDHYTLALRQQHERDAYEQGQLTAAELTCWSPGTVIQNRIRVEAGHTVGKTKLASGLVNHFFDTMIPSIIYTYAPSWPQIHDLLWKELKSDRLGKRLPGRILDVALIKAANHFVKGRATNDAGGSGTERLQGQHGKYLMFVLDEAEGVADYVFDAVESMTSGGISIVLMLANPRTRISRFHKERTRASVKNFRISCIDHPNVIQAKEVIPGAVRRDYVDQMIEGHCVKVEAPDDGQHTFSVPWQPDVIYKPDAEFLFRVLGIAPLNVSDQTLITVGQYEAACKRAAPPGDLTRARIGVDVARFGNDLGTIYVRHGGRVWREAQLARQDTTEYTRRIKTLSGQLATAGVTSLQVRVDGGGGFGGGIIDQLKRDLDVRKPFRDFKVLEVHFNGEPTQPAAYADTATQMYADVAASIGDVRIERAPNELEGDLCERLYRWMVRKGVEVKELEAKEQFKKRNARSPDDGDGFALAVAGDHTFTMRPYSGEGWDHGDDDTDDEEDDE